MKRHLCFCLILLCLTSKAFAFNYPKLRKQLPKNPVILECGANNGHTSVSLLRYFPDAIILAVEADPNFFPALEKKARIYPQIRPFHMALTSYDGEIEFYQRRIRSQSGVGSIFRAAKDTNIKLKDHPIIVPCQTLDTFCMSNQIEKCDFLYLDMQGGELGMLQHSPNILSTVSLIITEVLYEQIYKDCPIYPELKGYLESQGFEEIQHISRQKTWGDALFIRK